MDEVAKRVQAALWLGWRACIASMAHSILHCNQPGEHLRKVRIGAPADQHIESLMTLASCLQPLSVQHVHGSASSKGPAVCDDELLCKVSH